ncbi:MAG: hypothetical protein HQL32_02155 [Planctomycetes bacterium]|nr:hypothetical protein [Planctomycetota bacterium]
MNMPRINSRDLSDHFSPILVKEFRQGLRSQLFMWAFMLIHLFMAAGLLLNLSAGSSVSSRMTTGIFFWILVSAPLLLFLPFGAMGSVSQERRDGTLDLLQLAHQSSFRLILGKWMANAALTLLLVIAIVPYMVLRYYLGGMDIFADLRDLFFVLLGSGLLTSIAILCSSYNIHAFRQWIAFLFLGYFVLMALGGVIVLLHEMTYRANQAETFQGTPYYVFFVSLGLLYFLLKWATVQVAPDSEYHGLGILWFYIFFMLGNTLIAWLVSKDGVSVFSIIISVVLSLLTVSRSLAESPSEYEGQLRHFRKKGWIHTVHTFFMAPGWASAFFFSLISIALIFLNCCAFDESLDELTRHPDRFFTIFTTCSMAVITPLVIGRFLPFGPQSTMIRGLIAGGCMSIPFFIYAIGDSLDESWDKIFLVIGQTIPVSSLFCMMKQGFHRSLSLETIWISHGVLLIVLALFSYRGIKSTFALRRSLWVNSEDK